MHPVAARRILRLAFGTAAALWFSQVVNWDVSFIMPALVSFLLAVPMPAPSLKKGIIFVLALAVPAYGVIFLLPVMDNYRLAAILILIAACFWSFYYSAKGGSPVLGAFLTMGLALLTAVGSDSIDALLMVNMALVINAVIAMLFVWLAHAFFPDPPRPANQGPRPSPPTPERAVAIWSAWRATVIVFPVMFFFLLYQGSASYLVVMIKVASMGQQVENDTTRAAGKSLLMSTVIGGNPGSRQILVDVDRDWRNRRHHHVAVTEHVAIPGFVHLTRCPGWPDHGQADIQRPCHARAGRYLVIRIPDHDRAHCTGCFGRSGRRQRLSQFL